MPNGISQFNKRPVTPEGERRAMIAMAIIVPLYLLLFIWLHHKGLL
jgi:hypothetical protein